MSLHDTAPQPREGGVRTVETLRGPAGRLEAVFNLARTAPPPGASGVVLCHPHPLYGGTLHNKVVYHAMKVFTEAGFPVLRFNFRGAGRSEGAHDHGVGEQEDVRAAVDWLVRESGGPVIAAGFSFGAHMALRAGCPDPRVRALVSLGTPLAAAGRSYSYGFLATCAKPKLFLSSTHDEFGPQHELEAALAPAAPPVQMAWVHGGDHFFKDHLDQMQAELRAWLAAPTQIAAFLAAPETTVA